MTIRAYASVLLSVLALPYVMVAEQTTGTVRTASAPPKYNPPPNVRVSRDIEYARYGDHRLLLDLYRPAKQTGESLPVIVVVRGNAWRFGDKDGFAFIAGYLADAGFAAACIEYRPMQEAIFPAAVHDVKGAVRWVRTNASRFGLGDRVGAIGGSAGGHLVALLGTSNGEAELEGSGGNPNASSDVAAVVAMAPVTDFRLTWSEPGGQDGAAFLGPGLTAQDRRLLLASPVAHVRKGAAALLLIHSRVDGVVPYRQSVDLKARYDAVGAPVQLITLESAPHAFWNDPQSFRQVMPQVVAFFRRTLQIKKIA